MAKRLLSLAVCAMLLAPQLFGWGSKGHEMSARVAVSALPGDMPDFVRKAGEHLVYLCPEPDRWRTFSSQALYRINSPDHYFDLEAWGAEPLPASRYDLVAAAIKRGIANDSRRPGAVDMGRVGTAPYAVAEMIGKVISNFKDWRESSSDSEAARVARQAIEESIIYNAGVVAHYVTDLGNPLHCTVHFNGWAEGYPNPKGFLTAAQSGNLHARFESTYVERAISENDIRPRLPAPHRAKEWVAEMEQFIRRNNGFIEELYTLEQKAAFGSGDEPPEAKAFTAARLADAAGMLRDVWYSAWLVSGDEWLNDRVFVYVKAGRTVLDILREERRVQTSKNGAGEQVVAIGNRKNGLDGRTWQLFLNGQPATEAPDKHVTVAGERIEFRFEKVSGK